ncbi:putative baseplate assembly protein [Natrinema sp. HArc-T2]|uniref:putative baseplate assembly protein n=1 Tax=Natrinema sp. HArc-T2 TaxID=3242701 RepID=UPI00359E9D99
MSQRPIVDDRDREALYAELRELAAQYTESWGPSTDDNATVLLRIFSHLGRDVIQRLNDMPAKHRLAFLDTLGFDRRPPQAARLPLTFEVSTDIDRNVAIPGGTQAVAEPNDGPTQLFELPQDGGFEATGASLTDVIAVDPSADRIVDHSERRTGDESVELFSGETLQEHVLYLAHDDLLTLEAGSPITITVETTVDRSVLETELVWEYYGEADDGTVGWQPLEQWNRAPSVDDDSGLNALRKRLQSEASSRADDDRVELRFRLPGETVHHTVDGVESRWLRCRIAGDGADFESFSMRLQSISASTGRDTREDALVPDRLLSNDVPLSTDAESNIWPLGRLPHPPSTFYVASEEAFTKRGAIVEIRLEPPADPDVDGATAVADPDAIEEVTVDVTDHGEDGSSIQGAGVLDGPPELSWEYWTGSGWSRLPVLADETNDLQTAGRVRFSVPADIESTAVSGHESVWIRARLVRGNYGQPSLGVTDAGARGSLADSPNPPRFGGVSIHYDCNQQPFEAIRTKNNASLNSVSPEYGGSLTPFVKLPDETQTLYLGFNGTLRDGPLSVFVSIEDSTYPRSFDPGMRWEYCSDPDTRDWSKLTVQDRTAGLTERGLVRLTFPEPTTEFELFGRQRHWIRARVTQDEFDRRLDTDARSTRSAGETDRLRQTTAPPTLEGLYPNTQWAFNTRTVEDEVLGSSDGSHDQSFACAHAPVIDIDVWVDELETLSTSERRDLLATRPEDVRRVTDASGDVTEWWVRWQQVADMLDSAPTDRHFVVDRIDGTVSFGDGNQGRIPPAGQGNITVTYTTGGGRDGNVATDTITDLTSSIPLVTDVSNPKPADGGVDTEPRDALVSRTTTHLKHQGRAVTPSDYEQVATAVFRELAKVACNPCGVADDGNIVLLIVPDVRREKPMPSMELEQRIRDAVRERAPASLVESDASRIVVRGPTYAEVSVSVSVSLSPADATSVSLLKEAIERRLDEFLHPLDGNGGEGWAFGTRPSVDALLDTVTDTKHVAAVNDLDVTVEADGDLTSRSGRETMSSLPPDALVCSGTHEVSVSMAGGEHQ